MPGIGFERIAFLLTLLPVSIIAGLTLTGTVQSGAVLGGAILAAVAVIAFQAGVQYCRLRRA